MNYRAVILAFLLAGAAPALADIVVTDSLGREVRLAQPAKRIVALAPHVVENLYTAGVGDRLVGVVAHSDYPQAARALPRVGGFAGINLEALVALAPDLVIVWAADAHAARAILQKMALLELPVYVTNPRVLEDIARAIVHYGALGGRPETARKAALRFRKRLASLRARYAQRAPVRVFYQVWNDPLITLSGNRFVGAVIRLCGGRNVFADAGALAPKISLEAVLDRDPEAIVASGAGGSRPPWLDAWQEWPSLQAVREGHLFYIPPDLIQRPTMRILDGAEQLCRQLQEVRLGR